MLQPKYYLNRQIGDKCYWFPNHVLNKNIFHLNIFLFWLELMCYTYSTVLCIYYFNKNIIKSKNTLVPQTKFHNKNKYVTTNNIILTFITFNEAKRGDPLPLMFFFNMFLYLILLIIIFIAVFQTFPHLFHSCWLFLLK